MMGMISILIPARRVGLPPSEQYLQVGAKIQLLDLPSKIECTAAFILRWLWMRPQGRVKRSKHLLFFPKVMEEGKGRRKKGS